MPPFVGYTLPAPSGGINEVDAIDAMPESDALTLVNLYPNGTRLQVRMGYSNFCTASAGSSVRSLYSLPLADGTIKQLVCANNKFYQVDTGTAADRTGATVPTSNDWNGEIFAHRLFLCNGADNAQVWTGSGNAADSTFTGVSLSSLVNVSSYKERVYFVEKNSASFWYGNTKAVGASALTEFECDYFLRKGGRLLFAGSYTDRLATVTNDLFMAASSQGELLFYSGSSPSGTWELVARYVIGKPLSYRSFIRVDNDIWIITDQGIVPVSLLFSGGSTVAVNAISRKVNAIIQRYASAVGFSHLWHGLHWSAGRRVYIVVPKSATDTFLLVCNTETGAWTTYEYATTGLALAITEAGGYPYLGSSDGVVHKAETGYNDDNGPINFRMKAAFSFFNSRSQFKKFVDIRPLMRGRGGTSLSLGIDTDFKDEGVLDTITNSAGTFTAWGSPWGSPWSDEVTNLFDRFGLRGQGHSGAIRVEGFVQDTPLEFNAFEIRYEQGGQV